MFNRLLKLAVRKFGSTHCPPQTILGKQGALQKFLGEILGMNFCSSSALLKL